MKTLIILIAAAAIFWAWRILSSSRHGTQTPSNTKGQNMVACAYCGLHVPESESVVSDQQYYCCKEHSRLGPGKRQNE